MRKYRLDSSGELRYPLSRPMSPLRTNSSILQSYMDDLRRVEEMGSDLFPEYTERLLSSIRACINLIEVSDD